MKIIIIGGGPNGLAAGINLIELGYGVTILEAAQELGQGVTKRPAESAYAICHSGIYNVPGSLKSKYCQLIHQQMKADAATDDAVMKIFRQNTITTGKCIIARSSGGHEKLKQDVERLRLEGKINYKFLENSEDIAALNEVNLGDAKTLKSILHLPDVSAINIAGYVKDLEKEFLSQGGEIKFGHKVTGFEKPPGTIVKCENGELLAADLVINMAGLGIEKIANQARETLIKNGHHESSLSAEPDLRYFRMYGIAAHPADNLVSKNIIYNKENDAKNLTSTIGVHTYPSVKTENGWHSVFGYFGEEITQDQAVARQPYVREITADMVHQVKEIFPSIDPKNLKFTELGYRVTSTVKGINDFSCSVLQNKDLDFCVINSYTADSPGLTAGPMIAKEIGKSVEQIFSSQKIPDQKINLRSGSKAILSSPSQLISKL